MARARKSTVECVGCGYPLPIPDSGEAKVCCPSCGTVNIVDPCGTDANAPAGRRTPDEEDDR